IHRAEHAAGARRSAGGNGENDSKLTELPKNSARGKGCRTNLGFRYIPPWPRKHALFMTDFVAEAISKCTIHKPPLFFGFATCALATPASRPMIRHSIYNGMHLNVRSAVRSTRNTL